MTAPGSGSDEQPPARRRAERLVVVVGFDGSAPSFRALEAGALLIEGRLGTLEVVYVAHLTTSAEMSGALAESIVGFAAAARELAETVGAQLQGLDAHWHFQRRDGLIASELVAVADELHRDYGGAASVVIVVGSAMHTLHHVVGSVPVALVRHAKYPVVVVP